MTYFNRIALAALLNSHRRGCGNRTTETTMLGVEVMRNGWFWIYFESKAKRFFYGWDTRHEKRRLQRMISGLWGIAFIDMDSQLGRENQKLGFDVKFKIVFAPISRMSTGVTSYLSWDAVKMMVKKCKYPMMTRMRWVTRNSRISINLWKKKIERGGYLMK